MAEGVDNIVLEQLRLIREDLREVKDRLGAVETGQQGLTMIVVNLASNIHGLDERVEKIERKMEA